jgi:hypothetical protein
MACCPLTLRAQATQGSLLGTVFDASDSPIPGAKIVLRNEGTNVEVSMDTQGAGDYRFAGLEAGNYQITVTAAGFKTTTQTAVGLNPSQDKRVDFHLQIGNSATTVTVEGGTSQLETETSTLSNLKTVQDFRELPLSVYGRGWANVTTVVAGVQSSSGFEVNGARDTANNFTSDGISVNDTLSSRNTPNGFSGEIESLENVKVMTANNDAEYPQVAQFNAISRSGTNQVHGSVYWGNFNSFLSARSWADQSTPSFTNSNEFAVTNGGPVIIPKIYNGKDRTFYFFSYGGQRYRIGNRQYLTVPTEAFRNGDFSSIAGTTTILDPLNGTAFPGNKIPAARINPVSQNVQNLIYPQPNLTGTGLYDFNNYTKDPGGQFNSDVYSWRVDQKLSDRNYLFVRYGWTKTNQDYYPGPLLEGNGPGNEKDNYPSNFIVVSDTHSFTPAVVNEAKIGFSRLSYAITDINYGKDYLSQLGINGINNPGNDPAVSGMPEFDFNGGVPFAGTGAENIAAQAQNTYEWVDNLAWFKGRHNLKTGFDIRRYQINDENKPQSLRGQYGFDDQLSGFSYANFLLGLPSSATRSIARPNAYVRSSEFGFYAQDDFKLAQRITLNYGLRYEYQTPWVDKYNRLYAFDPSQNAIVTAGSTLPTDLVPEVVASLPSIITAKQAGLPIRSLYKSDALNFSPRIGLAIRPFGNATTVIRMGYGIYTQMWPGLLATQNTGGPWQSDQSFIVQNNKPTIQFPNPFVTTSQYSGLQAVSGINPNFPNERTQQWTASIGHQIWNTVIDIAYVGTRAQNIPYSQNLNLPYPSTTPYNPANVAFPAFTSVLYEQAGGMSSYNGLTIQADRHVSRGLTFNVNYTWAKALTNVDLRTYNSVPQQNQYDLSLERADDPNIIPRQLRFSFVYELPFGHGKALLGNVPGVINQLVGGWQLSGITTMYSGALLTPTFSGTDPADTNQFSGLRPDRVGDGNIDYSGSTIKDHQPIFDVNAFVQPATGRGYYGNSARDILVGPDQITWNSVLAKNFYVLNERARLQVRMEAFNAFNRANFANPSTNINSGAFGVVTYAGAGRSILLGMRIDY